MNPLKKLIIPAICFSFFILQSVNSQTLPYLFENSSTYSDDEIYIGLVGITDGHVWLDCKTSTVHPMALSDNTVEGPVINGNKGPGNNALYADCFTKLSDIPNKTINIPRIAGCRILISFGSPLYLYFFGHSGAPSGYAAPNLANPTDPNTGIRFEMIELTWNDIGLWTNTTRVDSYQYPMGLEVWGGASGFYKKVGELMTHEEVISTWKNRTSSDFTNCLNEDMNIILAPSKTIAFETGGAQADYMKSYIDQIWEKYKYEDLTFTSDAGTWQGRVEGEKFVFHNLTNSFGNATGIISRRPDTQEALEGKGVLAEDVQMLPDQQLDKVVQAQFCAALNRGAVDLNAASGTVQQWGDENNYFQSDTYNEYVKFWHNDDVSFEKYSYGFCYDDVYDKSSTIHTTDPDRVTVTIGGFGYNDNTEKSKKYHAQLFKNLRPVLSENRIRFNQEFDHPVRFKIHTLSGKLLVNELITGKDLILNNKLISGMFIWSLVNNNNVINGIITHSK